MAKQMAPDPAIGTWKLNVSKSTFKLTPTLKSETVRVEPWENGLKFSADIVDAQEKKMHVEAAYKLDGKDYPVKGSPLADTICAKRIDDRSTESVGKKGGKVVATFRSVISPDGRTLTQTRTGEDAQGQTVNDVLVFEKQ